MTTGLIFALVCAAVAIVFGGIWISWILAKPAGKSKLPIVLVVQEIFGVHEHIKDMARRFAKAGYLAIASTRRSRSSASSCSSSSGWRWARVRRAASRSARFCRDSRDISA